VRKYRFYILDADETLKGTASHLHFSGDGAAIKHVGQMIGGDFVELWEGERRIGRFDTVQRRKRSVRS
jgi:hypothetical protein